MVTEEASVDSDDRADEAWLLSVQRKLYQWSRSHPEDINLVRPLFLLDLGGG